MSIISIIANQLELNGGMRRDRGDYMLDAENWIAPSQLARRGRLYMLTEINRDPRSPEPSVPISNAERETEYELCHNVLTTVMREFYEYNPNATITSALRHALEVANQQTFNRNSAMLPPERRYIGLTVALVRNNEVFLAQMPPTQAYITHQGQLKYYPQLEGQVKGPRLVKPSLPDEQITKPSPSQRAASLPSLGRHSTIEPSFNRSLFEEGDVLVLLNSGMATALNDDQVERFFTNPDGREALYNLADFAKSQDIQDGYGLAVGAQGDFSAGRMAASAEERRLNEPGRGVAEKPFKNAVEGVAASVSLFASRLAPDKPARPREKEDYIFEYEPAAPVMETEAEPIAPAAPPVPQNIVTNSPPPAPKIYSSTIDPLVAEDDPSKDPWLKREDDDLFRPPFLRGRGLTDEPSPPPIIDDGSEAAYAPEAAPPTWGSGGKGRKNSKVRLETGSGSNNSPYFDMVAGDGYGPPLDSVADDRRRRLPLPSVNSKLLLVGLVILLAVAVLFVLFSALRGGGGSGDPSKAAQLLAAADDKVAQAVKLVNSDPARARKLIEGAQTDVTNAQREKPDATRLATTQNAIRVTSDNINRVTRPADLRLNQDFASLGGGVKITRALLSPTRDAVYLMDKGRGQILLYDLQGNTKTILKAGDVANAKAFTKPLFMAMRQDSIVVLDDANVSWLYDRAKNSWNAVTLAGSDSWKGPVKSFDTFQGNLYLVGPNGGQISRYSADNYANPPTDWLADDQIIKAGLDKAAAFAIDGSIYAVQPDGRFITLVRPNGKSKGEVVGDVDLNAGDRLGTAIKSPTILTVGSLDYDYFFVVDADKRVLQFQKKDGAFVQQFRAPNGGKEFDNINDLLLDEANKKLYLVADSRIFVFQITAGVPASQSGNATQVQVIGAPTTTPAR